MKGVIPLSEMLATKDRFMPPVSRKRRRLRISWQLFLAWFIRGTEGFDVAANPLPPDARLVGASVDFRFGHSDLVLLMESDTWSEVADGAEVPELEPVFFKSRDC